MTGPGDFHVASAWFHVEDVNATEEQEILFDTTQVLPSNIVVLTKNRPNHEAAIPGISYVTDVVFNSDSDGDGVFDAFDNCLDTYNPNQANYDGDSHGDACDNCPLISSEDYTDTDGDDIGDICDACPNDADNDIDEDTICGDVDNCPNMANTDQADSDGDGIGDVCDTLQGPVCGDVNCDGFCNVADAVYIINYAYRGGPAPCTDCPL
ncbi:MAG: thrombospondin type 3 repeat-containing protein [candidate division Zixibacteria bacterium]|nr:thrombospondin type 3 repeat-containing protein [candidate division Zixibacteria bacterium]